jgi:multiple sugar transport system substrate-binding protein
LKRKGSLFAALLALVALAAVLAATTAQARTAKAKAPSGNVTLSGWASSPAETQLLQKVIADFEKKYPSIHVNYAPINGDYPTAMLAKFAARTPPDVFYVDSNVIPDWIKQGVIQPLDSYITSTKFNTKAFYPSLLRAFTGTDGHIYGFPKDWSPLGMETNNGMFGKAGIKAAPKTWAQLQAAAQKLKSSGAVAGGAPMCLAADWARLLAFVYQNGGAFLNAKKTAATVDTPAVAGAVNFYVNFVKSGLAQTPAQLGVGWCGEALGKQKAAIIFEGNWLLPYMHDTFPGVSYGVSPLPKGKQGGNLAFTVSYSMARDSKNKPAAWTLLSYLVSQQGMKTWTSLGLALPSRSDVSPPGGRKAFLSQAQYAHAWQFAPGFSKVMDSAGNELNAVFSGSESVSTMLKKIQDLANQTLKSG